MWHIRSSVEQPVNAVTAVRTDHTEPGCLCVLLNNIPNLPVLFTGLHNRDGFGQAFVCDLHQPLGWFRYIPDKECLIQITVEPSVVDCHVYITQISILEREN